VVKQNAPAQKLRDTGFNIDEKWIDSLLLADLAEKLSPMIEYARIITGDSIIIQSYI